MTFETFKILHLAGFIFLFFGLGGLLSAAYSGVSLSKAARILNLSLHGLGILLIIVSGFGMLRASGHSGPPPTWITSKLLIWIYFAASVLIIKFRGKLGIPLTIAFMIAGIAATGLGVLKSF